MADHRPARGTRPRAGAEPALPRPRAVSGAAASLSNVGPGLGPVLGPVGTYAPLNDAAKWVCSFLMLVGRLELLTVYVLFAAAFWRG